MACVRNDSIGAPVIGLIKVKRPGGIILVAVDIAEKLRIERVGIVHSIIIGAEVHIIS